MNKLFLIPALFILGACSQLETLASDVAPVVAAAVPGAAPILTATASLACAGQALANSAGDSKLSTFLGVACTW